MRTDRGRVVFRAAGAEPRFSRRGLPEGAPPRDLDLRAGIGEREGVLVTGHGHTTIAGEWRGGASSRPTTDVRGGRDVIECSLNPGSRDRRDHRTRTKGSTGIVATLLDVEAVVLTPCEGLASGTPRSAGWMRRAVPHVWGQRFDGTFPPIPTAHEVLDPGGADLPRRFGPNGIGSEELEGGGHGGSSERGGRCRAGNTRSRRLAVERTSARNVGAVQTKPAAPAQASHTGVVRGTLRPKYDGKAGSRGLTGACFWPVEPANQARLAEPRSASIPSTPGRSARLHHPALRPTEHAAGAPPQRKRLEFLGRLRARVVITETLYRGANPIFPRQSWPS